MHHSGEANRPFSSDKPTMNAKLEALKILLKKHPSAVIAFSGGVDSTFLACMAKDVFPSEKILLVTATSSTYPESELSEAKALASRLGLNHRIIVSEEIEIPGFSENPPDRCYYCKRELFAKISAIAQAEGYAAVFDGSNVDDLSDFRPGRRALSELGVLSPLLDAGLTKKDIRELSAGYGLPTADKGSFACLASRFPYGEAITEEKLDRVGKAEESVRALGFKQVRVRSHGDLARVEIEPEDLDKGWKLRREISAACKKAGFVFACIDCDGYRTGAMNEALTHLRKQIV
jgi:uncharacterized protein